MLNRQPLRLTTPGSRLPTPDYKDQSTRLGWKSAVTKPKSVSGKGARIPTGKSKEVKEFSGSGGHRSFPGTGVCGVFGLPIRSFKDTVGSEELLR